MTYVHVYHVVEGSTGEQVFEDVDDQKARSRALEFAAATMDSPHANGPVVIWRTGRIQNDNNAATVILTGDATRLLVQDLTDRACKTGLPKSMGLSEFEDYIRSLYPECYIEAP